MFLHYQMDALAVSTCMYQLWQRRDLHVIHILVRPRFSNQRLALDEVAEVAVLGRCLLLLLHELLGHVGELGTVEETAGVLEYVFRLVVQNLLHEELA